MNPPTDGRSLPGDELGDFGDVGDGNHGIEGPSHAGVDVLVVEDQTGAAPTETEQGQQDSVEPPVLELESSADHSTTVVAEVENPPLRAGPSAGALWALGIVVACGRWLFSHDRIMFHMAPDEPAQLAMARWISGGVRWNLFDHATWRPGMATLMAPIFWITDDTGHIMRGGLMIAAALGGIGAVLLAKLGMRLTNLSPTACVLSSGAIALTASSLSATAFVWAEALVTVSFLATLMLLLKFWDRPSVAIAIATVAMITVGCTAHSRLLPLVPVAVVLLVAGCVHARRWLFGALIVLASGAATLISFAYTNMVFDAAYDDPGASNTIGTVLKRLPKVENNLRSVLGQTWYQLIATAGLTAIGSGVLVLRSFRRRSTTPARVIRDARLVILVTLPLVLVSMVFMSGRTRTDHRIYGRYNDAILWPVLLIAIAWLVNLRRTRSKGKAALGIGATLVAIVAATVGIHYVAGEALAESAGVRPMIAGLMPMTGVTGTYELRRLAIVATVTLVVLVFSALIVRRGWLLVPVIGGVLLWGALHTHDSMTLRLNSWNAGTAVTEIDELIPPNATLGVKFVREADHPPISWDDQRRRAQVYQFALPHHLFLRDRGVDDDVGPYVFAPIGDKELKAAGAEVIWTDPKVRFALWNETP